MTDREAWITFASAALSGLCAASGKKGYDDGLAFDTVVAADSMLCHLRERFPSDEPEVPDQYREPAGPEPASDPYEGIPKEVMERVSWNWNGMLEVDGGMARTDKWGYRLAPSRDMGYVISCPKSIEWHTCNTIDEAKATLIREAMRDGVFGEEYK